MEVTKILDLYEKQYADLNRRFVLTLLERDDLLVEKEQNELRVKNLESQLNELTKQLNILQNKDE